MWPRRILICGSRNWSKPAMVIEYVNALDADQTIITGGAEGVDTIAEQAARKRGLIVEVHTAKWKLYGRASGPTRNAAMVKACDQGIAFWDGSSRGTANTISLLRAAGKLIRVVTQ